MLRRMWLYLDAASRRTAVCARVETFASGCFPVFSDLPQYHLLLYKKTNWFLCYDSKGQQIEDGLEFAVQALVAGNSCYIN